MKIIPVFACLVIIVCVLGTPASGQDQKQLSFGVSPLFGMIYGRSEEIVYPSNTQAEYVSLLTWDMKPLFYSGARFDLTYQNQAWKWGIFSNASVKLGIPAHTGKMVDQDWQSITSTVRTDYSIHDNRTTALYWIDGAVGIFIPIRPRYRFKAFMDVSYVHVSFSGRNGYGVYMKADSPGIYPAIPDYQRETFSGAVINYTQDWFVVSPAVSFEADFLERFSAGLSFAISPLIWCKDFDEHLQRVPPLEFMENMRWGLFLEPKGTVTFTPARRFELSLEAAYRYITETKGEAYQRTAGTTAYTTAGHAGAGLSFLDTALFFKIRF